MENRFLNAAYDFIKEDQTQMALKDKAFLLACAGLAIVIVVVSIVIWR